MSVYKNYLKRFREERKQVLLDTERSARESLRVGQELVEAVREMERRMQLVGEPRYRANGGVDYDTVVEMEAEGCIVRLFGKDGVLKRWEMG